MKLHIGRMIDHVHLRAADLGKTAKFYAAILQALELPAGRLSEHAFQADELYISPSGPDAPPTHIHLAFQARDRAMVDAVYKAALAAGGTDNGGPGERKYHPGYYAAFMLDPDGNNIEAVYHGRSRRSAPSVEIETLDM